ncbi:MAG: NUDIX domain-containing protein [Caldilineaceae bacterium]|nr:NUDIX domain-containing protein [Caldilineaceae bacterium]
MTIDRNSLPKITSEVRRTWRRTRQDRSAGGVAYRYVPQDGATAPAKADGATGESLSAGALQIALIATHGNERWQLPKGSRESGETSIETAIREVEEETGLSTENIQFLQTIDYWYWDTYQKEVPELVHKLVDFYLLHVTSGELNDSSYEVDDVQWFTPEAALDIMTFEGEKVVVQQALSLLSSTRT